MRPLRLLDAFRHHAWEMEIAGQPGDDEHGAFRINGPRNRVLRVIASSGDGWDHVSVSLPDRTPTWEEMEHVKRLFFRDDETAMQLHVPPGEHINFATTCEEPLR